MPHARDLKRTETRLISIVSKPIKVVVVVIAFVVSKKFLQLTI